MGDILKFIFPSGNMDMLTPETLVCLFIFMIVFECVSAIIGEIMKGAGLK